MGPIDDPDYMTEKRKALQDMREAEDAARAAEVEELAIRKLIAAKDKDQQLSARNVQVKVAENRERVSGAAAAQREAQAIRRLADETARYRDQIEDAADEVGILTRKQIEMATLAGKKMDKPGGNLEKMDDALAKHNALVKKTKDAGFFGKDGLWVSKDVQQYSETAIQKLNTVERYLTRVGRVMKEGVSSRQRVKYAPDDPTLPGYEHPEQVYGRSLLDMERVSGVAKDKYGEPASPGSRIPQGRSMDDRMKLFTEDIGTRFQVASQLAKELFVSGDKAMELRLRAISDQYFGTDTQKPWEKAWNEDYFNPLTTIPESGYENLGINPSLLARVGGQSARGKTQDYSRAHPIHAIHMLKKLLADQGQPAGALMPAEAIDQAYKEIAEGGIYHGTNVKPDKRYLKTVDPVVNAMVKHQIGGLKAEIDRMIAKFQSVNSTLTGEARGSALSEIWTKIKAVQRAEGSDWTKARRDLMLELNPPKPDPYKDPELGNRMTEMFGRPNIPAGATINPEAWTGGAANQAAIAAVFGPAIKKRAEVVETAIATQVAEVVKTSTAQLASRPNNVTGLLAAGHVQDTVEKMGQVREAIQNQVEDAYDQVASVPQDMLNKALGGRPAIEYNKHAAEVMAAAARETSQVAQRQAENMAYLQEIKPLAAQARASLVEEAAATKDIMGRISPSVKGTYDQATWMKKMDQHKAILMAESQIGFQESSADEGRSQNQIAAEWARHWAKILPPTHKLGEIIDKATSGGLVAVPQKVIEDYITRLRVKYDKEQTRMGIPGYEHPVEGSTPTAEEMVGKDWFIKVKARTQADLAKAMGLAEGAPGFKTSTSGNLLGSGNIPGTGVERTATIAGRANTVEQAQQTLEIFKQIEGLSTIDHEKTSILLSDKKLSLGQRLLENANKLRFVNKSLVQSQMAMLGIYFSMMSVTNLLGQAWGKIGQSVGNLEGMFKSIGEALAFGRKGTKSYEMVRDMLKDTKGLVGAWKNYTGVMGLFSSMMTVIAYKLFTDVRVVDKIYDIMDRLATMISEPGFLENIIILFDALLAAIPEIIKGVNWLVGLFGRLASIPGFDKILGFMVGAGLAAAVAMPALAIFGGAFEALYLTCKGLGALLESSIGAKIIAFLTGAGGQTTLAQFSGTGISSAFAGMGATAGAALGAAILAAVVLVLDAWIYDVGGFRTWITTAIDDAAKDKTGMVKKFTDLIIGVVGGVVLTNEAFAKIWDALYDLDPERAQRAGKAFGEKFTAGLVASFEGTTDKITGKKTGGIGEMVGKALMASISGTDFGSMFQAEMGIIIYKIGMGLITAIVAAKMTFDNVAQSIVRALVYADWSGLNQLGDDMGVTIGNAIIHRLINMFPGGGIVAGIIQEFQNTRTQYASNTSATNTGSKSSSASNSSVSKSSGDIYITNQIGNVNSVANLREVLDAANLSAKYSYSGG